MSRPADSTGGDGAITPEVDRAIPSPRRAGALTAATLLIAVEGAIWLAAVLVVRQWLQSSCLDFGLGPCRHPVNTEDWKFVAAAIPGALLLLVAFPLWQRRRWAWLGAVGVQVALALVVALVIGFSLLSANAAGRSPADFARDLAVAGVLVLLQVMLAEIPQAIVLVLLLRRSSRRCLEPAN